MIRELITIENKLEMVPSVIQDFKAFAHKYNISNKIIMKMKIVFDELLSIIIQYTFNDEKKHTIHIEFKMNGINLIIIIEDDGIPFNPFEMDAPDTKLSLEEREIGGLGIHFVKNLIDEYNYSRNSNKNTVMVIKNDVEEN